MTVHEIEKRNEAYTARYTVDEPADPYAAFASESGPGIVGRLLSCRKGDWGIGQDNAPVPPEARFLFLVPETMRGWMKWLQLAAEAWDRCQQARMVIGREGLVLVSSGRAHPAVTIERDSRLAFARLIRELDLDAEPPASWSRPPALHSNRRNLRGGIGIKLDD